MAINEIRIDQLPYNDSLDGADLYAVWDIENAKSTRSTLSDLINYVNPVKTVNGISPTSTSNGTITLKLEDLSETSLSVHFTQLDKDKLNILNDTGIGDQYLCNDGTYKSIIVPTSTGIIFNKAYDAEKTFLDNIYYQNVEDFIYTTDFNSLSKIIIQIWLPNSVGTTTIKIVDSSNNVLMNDLTITNIDEDTITTATISASPSINGLCNILVKTNVDVNIKKIIIY
jgi:hypothetical protein